MLLVVIAVIAAFFGRQQGPEVKPLVPLAAGIWSLADLLTAFLLLAHFYVNGRRFFGLLAAAYGFTGLLAWPYLATFPGIFQASSTLADGQTSIYLWSIWHYTVPALVICGTLYDSALGRVVSRRAITMGTTIFAISPTVASAAVATLVFTNRHVLPALVVNGHFRPLFCE